MDDQSEEGLLQESFNNLQGSPQINSRAENSASSSRAIDRRQFRQQNPTILSS